MIFPVPRQRSQVWVDWTTPKGVRWLMRTWPVPPQLGQVLGEVPAAAPVPWQSAQVSICWYSTVFLQPLAASSKEMVRLAWTSLPRRGALGLALRAPPPKPPKKLSKMSVKSKPPWKGLPPPAPPPKLGSTPAWPNWSYRARFSLSERTS